MSNILTLKSTAEVHRSDREAFWKAWLTWLAEAPNDEANAFEAVLAPHAHHVRPLHQVLTEAFASDETRNLIPTRLHALLHSAGWEPAVRAQVPIQAVA